MTDSKKILWYNLAFMAFASVWGFANVVNGFAKYGGLQAIFTWILMFAFYFIPYALMVGELGSAFKNSGGGVSSWIHETISPKMAYYAGWTYWVVHMPYISQKPQAALNALSWIITGDSKFFTSLDPLVLQLGCLGLFLVFVFIATRGLNPLKNLATIAGSSMFVMSILFIILMMAAPAIAGDKVNSIDWSLKTFTPNFNLNYFTSLSILVFAVGGCERISPYVNKMKDPARGFSKGMIALAAMVAITAILGTIAMGMMFSSDNIPQDLLLNGAYYCFKQLGEYYGVGNLFLVIYALSNTIGQLSVLIVSIDAPLRMLLDNADKKYIPNALLKQNSKGVYINGYILVTILVSILIIIPALGIGNVNDMFDWLIELNSVCMPLRYLWVFTAYIALKKAGQKFSSEYKFTKTKAIGIIAGGWCFLFTAFACIAGMIPTVSDTMPMWSPEFNFRLFANIFTPFILILLGLIMPMIAKRTNKDI
ncbi:MAG: amino acid permease [Erysipelotrichaceae bacterium]|nr:amino acid permease [Erysipelotrichaceae bacterium]